MSMAMISCLLLHSEQDKKKELEREQRGISLPFLAQDLLWIRDDNPEIHH
jgi:hypothetical protein